MERRTAKRYVRRLRAILTDLANDARGQGVSVNLSATGMLVTTSHVFRHGARVRVELSEHDRSVVLEGVVARVVRARAIDQEGVGIRFLRCEEVLRELVPQIGPPATEQKPAEQKPTIAPTLEPVLDASVEWLLPPVSDPTAEPVRRPPPGPPAATALHRVAFGSLQELRRRHEQEIRFGGLFVQSAAAPRLDELVILELVIPGVTPLQVKARVVQLVRPGATESAASGFAVEFQDRAQVLAAIDRLVARGR
jgi:Tfp pilus assembly protein PilZ